MKKTLAALIAFGLFSGAASAQSFVQLRGNLDAGFIKESGSDASMGSFMAPRLKFIGQEDLGNGNKATFLLEERFNINGTKSGNFRWDQNLRKELEALVKKPVAVNVIEVRVPDMNAQLVAENIALQLEKRTSFRRAMKQAILRTMRLGAKGIKVTVGGRLGGAEIARTEHYHEGTIPLQTLRADIDYGFAEAHTTYGKIGVKVWIFKGEVLPDVKKHFTTIKPTEQAPARNDRRDRKPGDRRFGDKRPAGDRPAADRGAAGRCR